MANFLAGMDHYVEISMLRSDRLFSARVLKAICGHFRISIDVSRDETDYDLEWFHANYTSFPVYLEARRISLDANQMFKRLTRTQAWKELMALLEQTGKEYAGVVLNFKGSGLFVLHTAAFLPPAPGSVRLIKQAVTQERGVILEELESFLKAVELSGWTSG